MGVVIVSVIKGPDNGSGIASVADADAISMSSGVMMVLVLVLGADGNAVVGVVIVLSAVVSSGNESRRIEEEAANDGLFTKPTMRTQAEREQGRIGANDRRQKHSQPPRVGARIVSKFPVKS